MAAGQSMVPSYGGEVLVPFFAVDYRGGGRK